VPKRLVVIPGAGHDLDFPIKTPRSFELLVEFPETRDLLPEILAFLDSVWQVHLREHR